MKKKKSAGIIYIAKCKVTGEHYIGATTNSLKQRRLDHEERAIRGESNRFHEAIATYGPSAFTWEQVDTASTTDELAQKEKQYVLKFNAKDEGYNADAGGGFKKTVYQYDAKDGSLINTYDCLENAANAINVSKTSIGNACTGQNKTCKGYY
ncbi:NUMOD1 domain-containing DNA-binding protein [Aestuariibaculum sp. M13]|uniref:NUMOD1 domain-containing DNA-binding protein n=1 Tax=Aestuariibaculum sp. M13 TaxID=2967132 RepID=UPI002159F4D9|nr:NUMOD1 domain-containing DNA-binding protein [Aestuariibaculum sp. M13]MCR8667081.1 NUMOD1 domain-containing DNA-binding protein [Aestuariibaculum sp. M13]